MIGFRKGSSRMGAAVLAVALVIVSLVALVLVSSPVSAGAWPKGISGNVYMGDSSHPIEGASVVVEVWTGETLRYTYPETQLTTVSGFYAVTIGGSYWDEGDTIKVTATYEGDQKSESVTADALPAQTVDIIFPYGIPQLAGSAGMLIAAVIVGVLALLLLRKDRLRIQS